jgi:flagellar motility protein MotE (MotC chaperone)
MIRMLREFRLIPLVLIGTGCLFALKVIGLLFDGGYLLGSRTLQSDNVIALKPLPSQELYPETIKLDGSVASPSNKPSWMREIFGYPDVTGSVNSGRTNANNPVIVTGSTPAPKPASKDAPPADNGASPPGGPAGKNPAAAKLPPPVIGTVIPLDVTRPVSPAERAILERLHERRQELDTRARELDMREGMLKEAEKKLDARMNELKELEGRVSTGQKQKEEADSSRFKSLATMYENMKPKDAAKIFDRLDIKVLIDMTSQINPRRMSEILAQMSPDAAERLTIELASRASGVEKAANPAHLPKIEGRLNGG